MILKAVAASIWLTVIVGSMFFAALTWKTGQWLAWLVIACYAFRSLFDVLDEW